MRSRKKSVRALSAKNKMRHGLGFFAAVSFLAAFALGGFLYLFLTHTFFPLKAVVVSGNTYLSGQEVVELMGVKKGEGLFGASSRVLLKRLLGSPWVKAASLRKELPDRLFVMIKEAVPLAIVSSEEGLFLVDGEGDLLDALGGRSARFLPLVSVPLKDNAVFFEALNLSRELRGKGLVESDVEITTTGGPEGIEMRIDGLLVKMGKGEYGEKLDRLFELKGEIGKIKERQEVEYVDLRFANRLVLKPVSEVKK